MELSIAELGSILFNIENQDMTVRELRSELFRIHNEYSKKIDSEGWCNLFRKHEI